MSDDRVVAKVLSLAGGRVVGRIRFQKLFYLLKQIGLQTEFEYSYHHYGPYSAELSEAVEDAKAERLLFEETSHRRSDGMPFGIFHLSPAAAESVADQELGIEDDVARGAIREMSARSATILEIAATIHWLKQEPGVDDWKTELILRKGEKAGAGRSEQAIQLLDQLGIH